ncbi:quinone oxidoreductase family protein [Pseudomonas putida]|uniref:quinone oxidoreductase family protein n=1 Tax=Pseudomonas putida TaxID=303 RepID=UPI0023641EAF|nr:quinone oxidoreductase [Pseudomonas putida]MDD2104448.1 quinone oxidoreductase [Pseudomonas putida]
MDKAIVIHSYGGPAVLQLESVVVGDPGPGELKIRQTHAGVNFHDVYVRSGAYTTLSLPGIPGVEGVGYVEQVGKNVSNFKVGDRIIYMTSAYGAYASARLIPACIAIHLPHSIDGALAAAAYVKGLTVQMLLRKLMPVTPGAWVLVHAAAGGVGKLLVQALLRLGAQVIATVGSSTKAKQLNDLSCKHVILYRDENFVEVVKKITDGYGVDIVFDSVGKDTFEGSLEVLAPCGSLVNFGQSSGAIPPFDVAALAAKSATLFRPVLFHYVSKRVDLETLSAALFEAFVEGWLRPEPAITFPLSEAAKAHALLESRESSQPLVLLTSTDT